ncbi:hypothetical protein [Wolbachia endosymbiont of Trichogramma kaykai]|uniref:hypothetical protein n=1 Tax=Wolbachia endosymbiont of Trichogramma kaykai TaxID=444066 RepID=UPI00389220D8
MWKFDTLSNLVNGTQSCNKTFKARVLFNGVHTNPGAAKKHIEECGFLSEFDNLTRLDSFLSWRAEVQDASGDSMAIFEYKPVDLKAIREIESVYEEALSTVRKSEPAQSVLRLPPSLHQKLRE